MTPPDDVSTRLAEIRERHDELQSKGAIYTEVETQTLANHDVPYLLSLVEEVGSALAMFTESHLDRHVYEPLDQHGESEVADLLAALRDAAQEGTE